MMNNEDTQLIVGVVGTQNTGKSTFIQDVRNATAYRANESNRFVTVGVDYRKKIADLGLQINRNGNIESQNIIFDCLVESIDKAVESTNYNRIIMDRTPIDAYVYTLWLLHNKGANITNEILSNMYKRMMYYSKMLDCIVYIPLSKCDDVAVVDSKFRDTNLEYREQIDGLFQTTLDEITSHKKKIEVIEVYGTRDARVDMFLEWERRACDWEYTSREMRELQLLMES